MICGRDHSHGKYIVLTGIGSEAWVDAAKALGKELGLEIVTHIIGPRRDFEDHVGDWARAHEISDGGCLLVRPDHHVAWCAAHMRKSPAKDLASTLKTILGH